ncbi:histidine phosphatase family protein [Crateriforma spongiae]|uniref:histidine phosphatase family protein n=1 Tax=Crateriforma spongiae TaxID=2724528 RepID=UPI0039B0430F
MKLYLIRHAESQNNARPTHQRVCDPPLTARGRLQAQHLAQWMTTFRHDVLITSPFRRTLETTRIYLDQSPRPVCVWHNVFERGGCFNGYNDATYSGAPGLSRRQIIKLAHSDREQCVIDDTIGDQGWWDRPDREAEDETVRRAASVVGRFIDEFGDSDMTVVAVIHADFIRALLAQMIGAVVDMQRLGPIVNVGISRLRWANEAWHLDWLNSVSHMPARLVTGREQ